MCKMLEDMRNEAVMERNREFARALLQDGTFSKEKIAQLTGLTLEEVEALDGKRSA